MKKMIAVLAASTLAAPAFAGSLAEPVEPVVIPAEVSGSGSLSTGAWIGLAAAAAVLAVVAADDDDDNTAPATPVTPTE